MAKRTKVKNKKRAKRRSLGPDQGPSHSGLPVDAPAPGLAGMSPGNLGATVPDPVLEGSIYWPSKAAYHVTTWYSDGSIREHWIPGPAIPKPILRGLV